MTHAETLLLQDEEDDFFGSPSKQRPGPSVNEPQDNDEALWDDAALPSDASDLSSSLAAAHGKTLTQPHFEEPHFKVESVPDALTPPARPGQQQGLQLPQSVTHQQPAAQQYSSPPSDTFPAHTHHTSAPALTAPAPQATFQPLPPSSQHPPFSQSSASPQFFSPAQLSSQPQSHQLPTWPHTHHQVSQPQPPPLVIPAQGPQTHWPEVHAELSQPRLPQHSSTALPVHSLAVKTQTVASPLSPGPLQPTSGHHAQWPYAPANPASSAGQVQTQSVWHQQVGDEDPAHLFAQSHQQSHSSPPDPAAEQDDVAEQDLWAQQAQHGHDQQVVWAQQAQHAQHDHGHQGVWAQQAQQAQQTQHDQGQQDVWAQQTQHDQGQQDAWAQQAQQAQLGPGQQNVYPMQGQHDVDQQALWAQQAQHGHDQQSLWAPQPGAQQSRPALWAHRTAAPARHTPQQLHPQHQHPAQVSSPFAASPQSAQLFTPFAAAQTPAQPPFASSLPLPQPAFASARPPSQPPYAAAFNNPWNVTAVAPGTAAVVDERMPDEDVGHRSLDGRPPCALLAFGFAGKLYLWQPTPAQGILQLVDLLA